MVLTRRRLLRVGAATGVAALAGCGNPLGGGGREAGFGEWLYEPGTVTDTDHYLALRYEPSVVAEHASALDGDVYDLLRAAGSGTRDLLGLGFAGTDAQLGFGNNGVLTGDFDADDVTATLTDADFVNDGTAGDFDTYVGPDEDAAVALTDGTAVVARSTGLFGSADNARLILRALLDVQTGAIESYVEDSADFGTLVDELGDGAIQSARTHPETDATDTDEGAFAGEVARGVTSSFVDDGIETTFALVFNESADIDTGDVEDWVEAAGDGTFANFESVDVSTSERTALVTGTEPTREYDFYLEGF